MAVFVRPPLSTMWGGGAEIWVRFSVRAGSHSVFICLGGVNEVWGVQGACASPCCANAACAA